MRKQLLKPYVAILPWLELQDEVKVNGIRFVPFPSHAKEILSKEDFLHHRRIGNLHADINRKPIARFSIAVVSTKTGYRLPNGSDRQRIFEATNLVALVTLANREFLGQLGNYTNSLAFRLYLFSADSTDGSVFRTLRRRGRHLGIYDARSGKPLFYRPAELESTSVPLGTTAYARALSTAKRRCPELYRRIVSGAELFLAGNTDSEVISEEVDLTLTASAFERLLEVQVNSTALELSKKFAALMAPYGNVTIGTSKRCKHDKKYPAQGGWFLHQKWLKELYERRSEFLHASEKDGLTKNWKLHEHLLLSALVFPLLVKLLLSSAGQYTLDDNDKGMCLFIDQILDQSDWGFNWRSPNLWARLLSRNQSRIALDRIIREAYEASRRL